MGHIVGVRVLEAEVVLLQQVQVVVDLFHQLLTGGFFLKEEKRDTCFYISIQDQAPLVSSNIFKYYLFEPRTFRRNLTKRFKPQNLPDSGMHIVSQSVDIQTLISGLGFLS